MTRELKLALIVGFALVLVVTVLISDHLSHARQTRLASLPTEPAKVTEPPPIALENGADTLPRGTVTEPTPNAPAPLIGSMPTAETEPLVLVQGTPTTLANANGLAGTNGPANGAAPAGAGTIDLINPLPQSTAPAPIGGTTHAQQPANISNQVQPIASNTGRTSGLEDVVRNVGAQLQGDTISFTPGVQTTRQAVNPINGAGTQPQNTNLTGVQPLPLNSGNPLANRTAAANNTPAPTSVLPPAPVSNDKVHTVASGEHLFKLCKQHYGDGKLAKKLAKYNGIDPSTPLKIGQKIKLPSSEVLTGKPAPTTPAPVLTQTNFDSIRGVSPVPGGTNTARVPVIEPRPTAGGAATAGSTPASKTRPYTIKKGDSLAAIAQKELGTIKRAKEIVELNKKLIKNPNNVPLGVTIQLPAA
ncbi:MAG TPA: LysM peptidoglycan-binding domain-containing protein [Phycisphaerales bacterium]|nr:LysM peptidoglycan-binding domain-containing protein [Phycisphaerales bacterium]